MLRVVDADARRVFDVLVGNGIAVVREPHCRMLREVKTILRAGDAEGTAEAPGTDERHVVVHSGNRCATPDEYRRRMISAVGHDVETVIHPIDEIHVCRSGRGVECFRARRSASRCMTREILFAVVCFYFRDSSDAGGSSDATHEQFPEKVGCYL